MPHASRTVAIDAPIEQVFAFFTTPENDRKWRSAVKEIHVPPSGMRSGTIVQQAIAGPFGKSIPADYEVTRFQHLTTFAFSVIAGPVRPKGRFDFRQTATGSEVEFTLDAQVGGVTKLLSRAVKKSMNAEMASLDKAKALLEA